MIYWLALTKRAKGLKNMGKLFSCILSIVGISSMIFVSSAFGANTTTHRIQGNPIGRRDDYTINSSKAIKLHLSCVFSNTGAQLANLDIWTSPTQTTPIEAIHLKDGSKNKPYNVKKNFTFELNKKWWCQIYSRAPKKKWPYCAYFSVSDATIAETYPFATWDKTIHSKYTRYDCVIKSAHKDVSIFYFKH